MKSENGLNLNLDDVFRAIETCDVMVLGFSHLAPRVLFDTRQGSGGPLFRMVRQVSTPAERFAQLRKLRPGLSDPERYLFLNWPVGLDSLLELGIWGRIVERCIASAGDRAREECEGILERLRQLDRKEEQEAIAGDSYRTIWPPRLNRRAGERE
jgi:hypothetical protein